MFDLHNKTALVTGASRGIGKEIALKLAKAGADVIINYNNSAERAQKVAEEISSMGNKAWVVKADMKNHEEISDMFDFIEKEIGNLDILVNNAGVPGKGDILTTSLEEWQRIIDINLTGVFLCSKYAFSLMKRNKTGRIINVSSVVAHRGAIFGTVNYAASKSGLLGFSKTLAITAADFNITVNVIAPGITATDLIKESVADSELKNLESSIPLGIGQPEDIAYAAVFLASSESRYITGTTIDVNGGVYLR